MRREALVSYLDQLLSPKNFQDYCPNGLQVEGRAEIQRIVFGVTASHALVEAAIAQQADAVLVHHGWFWKGEESRLVGLHKRRIALLMAHDINLLAYHLPLDAHPELGNNAQLARLLNWSPVGCFGDQSLVFWGHPASPCSVGDIKHQVEARLGRVPLLIGVPERSVTTVAWCSGAGQGLFAQTIEQALALGVNLFLSGEISEPTVHWAREAGIAYLAAGHHATERYGVQALCAHLRQVFALDGQFIDLDNPV